MSADFKCFIIVKSARRTVGKIIYTHLRAHETANSLRVWRYSEKFVQSPAFVRFVMTEPYPAKFRWIDERRDRFERGGERFLESSMHQEWFVIFDQKLVELDSIIRVKRGNTVNIRGDFIYFAFHLVF